MRNCLLLAAVSLACAGCGGGPARVKGRLVENGQPMKFPPTSAAVEIALLKDDGTPDATKTYNAVVNEDGTFEVVASGGQVTPGTYRIGVQLTGQLAGKYKELAPGSSSVRREIKSGLNEL